MIIFLGLKMLIFTDHLDFLVFEVAFWILFSTELFVFFLFIL